MQLYGQKNRLKIYRVKIIKYRIRHWQQTREIRIFMPSIWNFLMEERNEGRTELGGLSMFYKRDCSFRMHSLWRSCWWDKGAPMTGFLCPGFCGHALHVSTWGSAQPKWKLLSGQAEKAWLPSVCKLTPVAMCDCFRIHSASEDVLGRNK